MVEQINRIIDEITSGVDERAEKAAQQIPSLPPSMNNELIQKLENLIASDDIDLRWWGLRALALIPDPRIADILLKALSDESPEIRQCAALGLKLHPVDSAVKPLVDALDDSDNLVATLAADSLIAIGEPAVDALIDVIESGSRSARREAVRALVKIGDKRAIPALYKALDDDSALVAYWAEQGLDDMGLGMILFKPD